MEFAWIVEYSIGGEALYATWRDVYRMSEVAGARSRDRERPSWQTAGGTICVHNAHQGDRDIKDIGIRTSEKTMSIYHADMTAKADSQSALAHLAFCQQHESEMLELLRKMVEIESPSDDKAAV